MLQKDEFLEHNLFANNYYGTAKKEIDRISQLKKVCIMELDINGANQIHKIKYPANYIAILPPDVENIKLRLNGRGTESEELIQKRISSGIKETEEINNSEIFNYKIINGDLEETYIEFKSKINSLYPTLGLI